MKGKLLGLVLIGTLVAAYFAPDSDDTNAALPVKTSINVTSVENNTVSPIKRAVAGTRNLQIRPRNSDEELGDVFGSQTWALAKEITKPLKVEVLAPPAPQAPALPFRFLGRLVDGGKTAYFFQFNERNLIMQPGDSVDDTYILNSVEGGVLTFTYLPLNERQTLVVGEVN